MHKTISIILLASLFVLCVSYACFADDAEDLYDKGMDYYQKGDLENALKYFNESIMMRPNYASAHYGIGLVYSSGADYEKAVRHFNQALQNKPAGKIPIIEAAVLSERAKAYENMGKEMLAVEDYKKLCYTYGSPSSCTVLRQKAEVWEKQGLSYKDKKDYIHAKAYFSKAIKIDPKYPDPYFNRGLVEEKLNQDNAAIEDFNKHIELAHKSSGEDAPVYDAYFSLGLIARKRAKKTGKKEYWIQAETYFGIAVKNIVGRHESNWPKSTPDYFYRMAEAIYEQGGNNNKKRALQYLMDGCNVERKHSAGGDMRCCRNEDRVRDELGLKRRMDWD